MNKVLTTRNHVQRQVMYVQRCETEARTRNSNLTDTALSDQFKIETKSCQHILDTVLF